MNLSNAGISQDSDYSHGGRAVSDWMGPTGGHLWDWYMDIFSL